MFLGISAESWIYVAMIAGSYLLHALPAFRGRPSPTPNLPSQPTPIIPGLPIGNGQLLAALAGGHIGNGELIRALLGANAPLPIQPITPGATPHPTVDVNALLALFGQALQAQPAIAPPAPAATPAAPGAH